MASEESQDWSCAASGWEAISFFVFLLYSSKAAVKIVSKFVEEVGAGGIWDILIADEPGWILSGLCNRSQEGEGVKGP